MSAVPRRHGREHVVLERQHIAERWRSERWDSLRFQFPNWSVKVPAFDQGGRPVQHRGVTQLPGLYFLGLHWMHTIKSGLPSGVGSDAEHLAEHMARTH